MPPTTAIPKIDINTAAVGELTQLPGIAKNVAYNIVNHRQRHGLFTAWEEFAEVKDFPTEKLEAIKLRAELRLPEDVVPRRIKGAHVESQHKKTAGYTKAMRSSRRPGRMHDPSEHRPH